MKNKNPDQILVCFSFVGFRIHSKYEGGIKPSSLSFVLIRKKYYPRILFIVFFIHGKVEVPMVKNIYIFLLLLKTEMRIRIHATKLCRKGKTIIYSIVTKTEYTTRIFVPMEEINVLKETRTYSVLLLLLD